MPDALLLITLSVREEENALIEQIKNLEITSICVMEDLQPRVNGLDDNHVTELEKVPDSWQPLVVVQQDKGYILVDGFHRYAAAQNLGMETVTVRIADMPSDGDLHALAFALNAVHGRPLSLADRRGFAKRLLLRRPELADREIGRRCGLSQPTVAAVRQQLEESAQISQTETRIGAGGYTYSVGTNPKQRSSGELPDVGLLDTAVNAVTGLFSPAERTNQRRIAQYLQRLSVALADQHELKGWENSEDAADACRLVLGADRARELAQTLGDASCNILDVAIALGYKE
jgi:hypothetical protein